MLIGRLKENLILAMKEKSTESLDIQDDKCSY